MQLLLFWDTKALPVGTVKPIQQYCRCLSPNLNHHSHQWLCAVTVLNGLKNPGRIGRLFLPFLQVHAEHKPHDFSSYFHFLFCVFLKDSMNFLLQTHLGMYTHLWLIFKPEMLKQKLHHGDAIVKYTTFIQLFEIFFHHSQKNTSLSSKISSECA